MNRKLFCIYDAEKNFSVGYYEATSAHKVIRDNWRYYKKINPYFYEDWQIFELGDISPDGKYDVKSARCIPYKWDEFDLTEAKADSMSKEEVERLRNQ